MKNSWEFETRKLGIGNWRHRLVSSQINMLKKLTVQRRIDPSCIVYHHFSEILNSNRISAEVLVRNCEMTKTRQTIGTNELYSVRK